MIKVDADDSDRSSRCWCHIVMMMMKTWWWSWPGVILSLLLAMPWCRHVSGYWQGPLRHRHRRHAGRLQGGHQAGRALEQEVEVVFCKFCNFVHFYVFTFYTFGQLDRFICKLIISRYEFLYPRRPAWFLRCFLSAEVINFLCWEEEVCVSTAEANTQPHLIWG